MYKQHTIIKQGILKPAYDQYTRCLGQRQMKSTTISLDDSAVGILVGPVGTVMQEKAKEDSRGKRGEGESVKPWHSGCREHARPFSQVIAAKVSRRSEIIIQSFATGHIFVRLDYGFIPT